MRVKIGKKHYEQFCESEKNLPLFFQNWYLDAVCQEGDWDVVLLLEQEEIIAVLPYFYKRKAIFRYLTMPHLCFQMGPYIVASHRDKAEKLIPQLLQALPKFDFIEQRWHYSILGLPEVEIGKASPNVRTGWKTQERYSYRFEDLSDLTKVYKNIYTSYRNNKIKRAKTIVRIEEDLTIEAFYRINKMTFDRQGIAVPYSLDFLKRLDETCAKRKARKILYAIDDKEQIHSVAYLVWDQVSSYLLMGGDDPSLRKSGAGIYLTWKTVEYTKEKLGLNIYDFEGSMIPGVEQVRKSFGASRKYYLQVNQERSRLFKWISKLRNEN